MIAVTFCKGRFITMKKIKGALLDLSGTLHVEDEVTANAVEALKRLRETGVVVKFVTNTTKESSQTLYQRLRKLGFELEPREIYSSLSATATYVQAKELNPFYLVSKDARTDFPADDNTRPLDSVVVGLAPDEFYYENLNKAFNILLGSKEKHLIAIHQGKYFKSSSGMALGPGCFVKGLEYATGATAVLIGKPNEYFFRNALPEGLTAEDCVMIGDDANDDIEGAMKVGLMGIQVKTGKYLPNVVPHPPATAVIENFYEAVEWIKVNNQATELNTKTKI